MEMQSDNDSDTPKDNNENDGGQNFLHQNAALTEQDYAHLFGDKLSNQILEMYKQELGQNNLGQNNGNNGDTGQFNRSGFINNSNSIKRSDILHPISEEIG